MESLDRVSGRYKVVGRRTFARSAVHATIVRPYIIYYSVEGAPAGVFIHTTRHGYRRQPRRSDEEATSVWRRW